MVDQNALIGKFSQDVFIKHILPRVLERQKNIVAVLKQVQIFSGLPNSFFHEFSKFVSEDHCSAGSKVLTREEKPRFVYFLKDGTAELRLLSSNKPPLSSNPNYYVTSQRPYSVIPIVKYDSFGMEWGDQWEG